MIVQGSILRLHSSISTGEEVTYEAISRFYFDTTATVVCNLWEFPLKKIKRDTKGYFLLKCTKSMQYNRNIMIYLKINRTSNKTYWVSTLNFMHCEQKLIKLTVVSFVVARWRGDKFSFQCSTKIDFKINR